MAGDERLDEVVAYLSRLTGGPVSADGAVHLRSVHRAAFASWARQQAIPVRFAAMAPGAAFSVRDLLGEGGGAAPVQLRRPASAATPDAGPLLGVGIDIEEVGNLPATDDYREHPFYQGAFTPSEIAYCVRQADARASLCGTWAAKEAVVKSGAASAPPGRLSAIEIGRDAAGRPTFPGCQLSISHTASTAVAVCLAGPGPSPARAVPAEEPRAAPPAPAVKGRSVFRRVAAYAGAAAVASVLAVVAYAAR